MKKLLFVLLVVLLFAFPTAALAALNWHDVTGAITDNGALVVSFKETGLGDTQMVEYSVTAAGSADYACINRGGHNPKAHNKRSFSGPLNASGTLAADHNGRIVGSITLGPVPPAADWKCPKGQTATLVAVSYTDITLCDDTNGVCYPDPIVVQPRTFWP